MKRLKSRVEVSAGADRTYAGCIGFGLSALSPAQPVDATLYTRWKDGVYSVISEEIKSDTATETEKN